MIDFDALKQHAASAPPSAEALRRELDPRYVLHVHGHAPAAYESGRVLYHSPFRPDTKPSYTVRWTDDRGWRCGDYARGREGDVLDLVRDFHPAGRHATFQGVMSRAENYLILQRQQGWTAPPLPASPEREVLEDQVVDVIRNAPLTALTEFLRGREGCLSSVPPEFLRYHYGVAEIGDELLIPYTRVDGSIAALKKRSVVTGHRTESLPGFRYGSLLYGLHLLANADPRCPVILCEGETDCWAVAYHAPEASCGPIPLGVPTGASTPPTQDQLAYLHGREVLVAFDGDEAGDEGAKLWPFPRLRPPDGMDLASMPADDLKGLLP